MLTGKQKQVVEQWGEEICKYSREVDPSGELHWNSMFIGFAIGRGLSIEAATDYNLYEEAFKKETEE